MKKTVCELFAGVGGFRCGLNKQKIMEKKKNGIPFGLVSGSQQRKIHSTHMIVMYIDLEHD